ncbi:MAG: rhodanese-like domain-containing protein, partial [Bacteroidales bacterium]
HLNYTPREALARCLAGSLMLDIRPEVISAYKGFDVPELIFCPLPELEPLIGQLPSNREIIVADSTGVHSREAINLLVDNGYKQVAGLAGGMVEWERDGLPLKLDNKARLSGSCMCQLKFREKKKT